MPPFHSKKSSFFPSPLHLSFILYLKKGSNNTPKWSSQIYNMFPRNFIFKFSQDKVMIVMEIFYFCFFIIISLYMFTAAGVTPASGCKTLYILFSSHCFFPIHKIHNQIYCSINTYYTCIDCKLIAIRTIPQFIGIILMKSCS